MITAVLENTRHWWPYLRRGFWLAFFVVVATLLIKNAKQVEWDRVINSVRSYEARFLLLAVLGAALGYLVLSSFDLLGRVYTGHHLSTKRVMMIGFVTYCFILNLSAFIGGVRYRLYAHFGVGGGDVTRIWAITLLTNWVAYLVVAGLLFSFRLVEIPSHWKIGAGSLQLLGFLFAAIGVLYVLVCTVAKRRSWTLLGHEITLPGPLLTFLQLLLGMGNWLTMAAIVYILLQRQVSYPVVLGVLMLSSLAVLIAHVPAGLGVLEAVFVVLLQDQLPNYEIIAAVFTFRAVYYLLPFVVALPLFFWLEALGRHADG